MSRMSGGLRGGSCVGVPVEEIKAEGVMVQSSHSAPQQTLIEHLLCAGIVLGWVVTWREECSER